MKINSKIYTTQKNEDKLKNRYDLKDEEDLRNEKDLRNEEDIKNEEFFRKRLLKNKDVPMIRILTKRRQTQK